MTANEAIKLTKGDGLVFPVLALDRYSFSVRHTQDELTVVWSPLIESGWFKELRLIDALGGQHVVSHAKALHGVGGLWGYDPLHPFWGRRMKMELEVTRVDSVQLDWVKEELVRQLESWHGWKSRDDYDELLSDITGAVSIRALMESLTKRGC